MWRGTMHDNGGAIPLAVPAWRLDWLTPVRCRVILVLLLGFGFFSHARYLNNDCPIDLSGDEAQYWDWSRNLDLSYYSKGPLIAYIIRASCSIFGETMPAVRYPALVLGVGTSLLTYLLTRFLFKSERLALGAVLLFHIVPMFIAGSVLMTIDSPMFFCWALATYLASIAIFNEKRWLWVPIGMVIGIGALGKYATLLWFLGVVIFLISSGRRKDLYAALGAFGLSLLCLTPVVIWNSQHDWVSVKHVTRQIGVTRPSNNDSPLELIAFMIGAQIGMLGPIMAVFVILASRYVLVPRLSADDSNRQKLLMLTWIGLAYWGINFIFGFFTKIQPNWPAPAYFTLMIVVAYFLGTRLQSILAWKRWRGWFYGAVATGLVTMPIAHDTAIIYPILKPFGQIFKRDMADMDVLARLRGWKQFGAHVSDDLKGLGEGAFVMCDDYQQTAEMAFYVKGQPKTYCAGPYFASNPKRLSQYDMWADRRLDPTSPLVGRNAVFVGKGTGSNVPEDIANAFERVEDVQVRKFEVNGVVVRTFKTMKCYGFKGMALPAGLKRDY